MSVEHAASRNTQRSRIVIVGAGFGGLAVARGLRDAKADVQLIDQHNHHLFQPMMYQVAMAQLRASDIAAPLRELFSADGSVRTQMDAVRAIDLGEQRLSFTSGLTIHYDLLVLATGARYQYLGHPQWRQHVLKLKSLEDALTLRERVFTALEHADRARSDAQLKACLTFVIVGAGATGVEIAGALARLLPDILNRRFRRIDAELLRIVLIDPESHALSSMPAELGQYADRKLRGLGVQLMLDTSVDDIKKDRVHLKNGQTLDTATIIWAAGVEGHGAGDWLPDDLVNDSNRVPVNDDLSLPGHPDIYVIGDAAYACDENGKRYPGLAAVAKQQGTYVAKLIRARLDGNKDHGSARFEYRDYGSMAMIANGCAVARIRGRSLKGLVAWMLWGVVHLYFLVSMRNRVLVLFGWFWAMLSGRRQRVILGDVSRTDDDPVEDQTKSDSASEIRSKAP